MPTPTYLTATRVTTRMGETFLETLTGLDGASLTTEIETTIVKNENIIHGFVGKHYDTPLTSAAGLDMAEEWAFKLTQYELHLRGAGDDVQTKVRLAYEDAMKELKMVSEGKLTIPGEDPPDDTTMGLYIDSDEPNFEWEGDAEDTY